MAPMIGRGGKVTAKAMLAILGIVALGALVLWNPLRRGDQITGNIILPIKDVANKGSWSREIEQCNNACITDDYSDELQAVEFCAYYKGIDVNGDGITHGKNVTIGGYTFCEEVIPCFLVMNDSACPFDGYTCNDVLKRRSPTYYSRYYSADGSGGCGLDPSDPNNWITKYGFNETP